MVEHPLNPPRESHGAPVNPDDLNDVKQQEFKIVSMRMKDADKG